MQSIDLSDLLRSASQSPLGVLGLLVIAASLFSFLLFKEDGKKARLAVFAALGIGAASWFTAILRAQPGSEAGDGTGVATGSAVITIDRTNDYPGGSPGGVFDTNRTNHMIRNSFRGGMWTPAGGAPPYRVSWFVQPHRAGRYELQVRYAAEKIYPAEVRLDDKTLFPAFAQTTGSPLKPAWFTEGTIELHEGVNRLGFHSEVSLPNIDAVRLVRLGQD